MSRAFQVHWDILPEAQRRLWPKLRPTVQLGLVRRCRRGMKELDLLTLGDLEPHYPSASAEDQPAFAELLEVQDHLLMSYVVGRETPADPATAHVISVMRTLLTA